MNTPTQQETTSLFATIGKACRPVQKGYPVLNGVKQNYYKFGRPRTVGAFWIGYEYDAAWSTSIAGALGFLEGNGWDVVSITKYEVV